MTARHHDHDAMLHALDARQHALDEKLGAFGLSLDRFMAEMRNTTDAIKQSMAQRDKTDWRTVLPGLSLVIVLGGMALAPILLRVSSLESADQARIEREIEQAFGRGRQSTDITWLTKLLDEERTRSVSTQRELAASAAKMEDVEGNQAAGRRYTLEDAREDFAEVRRDLGLTKDGD